MGVINKLLGRLKLYADPSVTTQTTTVVQASTANSNLALVPGGGALTASIPDGTAAGGNARGQLAVDWQMYRTSANQVAAGNFCVISGGNLNRTGINFYSTVVGGSSNLGNGSYCVTGGTGNTASADATVAFGYSNTASSNYSTVPGGQSNTASTNTHATVVGGNGNTASGIASIAGGSTNTASGQYGIALGYNNNVSGGESSVALGYSNTISGFRSFAVGNAHNVSGTSSAALGRTNTITSNYAFAVGYLNSVSGENAAAFGLYAGAGLYGSIVNASGRFAYAGDAQVYRLLARKEATLTTGATATLSLDGTGTTNLIDFGFSSDHTVAMPVRITWSAGVNDPLTSGLTKGDCIGQTDQIMLKKLKTGNISIVGTVTTLATNSDATMSTCTMNYSVSGYGQLILQLQAPTFGGGGSLTLRVLANIEATQCIVAPF